MFSEEKHKRPKAFEQYAFSGYREMSREVIMGINAIMQILKLNKKYDKFSLQNVTLELPRGSIMGFIGPNGAGKSTTIKSILGIIPFDSGEILIDGMDNVRNEMKVKQIIGFVSERLNLYEEVSGAQLSKFISKFYVNWDDNYFQHLIKVFRIDLTKKIGTLSKGTALKFALALALSHHPKLLILDEPTSGLDPIIRNETLELLEQTVYNEEVSIFFSSHITEDIVKIANYVTYINNGIVLLSDKKEDILRKYKKVIFSKDIPSHIKQRLTFYRNRTAIVDANSFEYIKTIGLQSIISECSPALLDEILIMLIKEDTSDGRSKSDFNFNN
jgi:ABC-2 type transport system ATP-binding protein